MSAAELKLENERLKQILSERESDNEKLRQQGIVGMFSSLETLIKFEIQKVYLKLDGIIVRIDTVNNRQEVIESQTIPRIEKEIQCLKDHTLRCPAPNGVVKDLEKKLDDHVIKTKWTSDIIDYKWLIVLIISIMVGKNLYDIIALILLK